MQGRDTGIFTRKKRFFLISPNFQGAFSRKIGQKGGFFAVGVWLGCVGALSALPLFLSFLSYKRKSAYLWAKVGTFGRKSINALPELMMT